MTATYRETEDTTITNSADLSSLPSTLHPFLLHRIRRLPTAPNKHLFDPRITNSTTTPDCSLAKNGHFVLYIPTVNLRKQDNPAFALACHIANQQQKPLLVLAIVLDDSSHHAAVGTSLSSTCQNNPNKGNVVGTARRLAFVLEALQKAAIEWSEHGAAVAIRVHGPQGGRAPHHLSLTLRASSVVVDEPFVHPYLHLVQQIESHATRTPVYRVDGSTTIPIHQVIQQTGPMTHSKAWKWLEQSNKVASRYKIVNAVVDEGIFEAPKLEQKTTLDGLSDHWPSDWKNEQYSAPQRRPWTVEELRRTNVKEWVINVWGDKVDQSVRPCAQTDGGKGHERWKYFLRTGLARYAQNRNNIKIPHAVSRMSCFLNYGTVSIFRIMHDVYRSRNNDKFVDEIIKWREFAYAHAFQYPDSYYKATVLPQWALNYLSSCRGNSSGDSYPLHKLDTRDTSDPTWNSMQDYLHRTGELHNNARMTWGKTLVHWQKYHYTSGQVLEQMCYLNDRYALDGLSPPSYLGLLWCLGYGDNPSPGGAISEKWAHRYKANANDFEMAVNSLLKIPSGVSQKSILDTFERARKQQKIETSSSA